MLKYYDKKFNCITLKEWNHHAGGWKFIVSFLEKAFHSTSGVPLYTNGIFSKLVYEEKVELPSKWVGICHFAVEESKILAPLLKNKLNGCVGIFTHSQHVANILKQFIKIPINFLFHATPFPSSYFNLESFFNNKKCIFIGHWLRRYDRYNLWESPFEKNILKCLDNYLNTTSSIKILNNMTNLEYQNLFKNNIVFLDLKDSSCNNTLLECIVRNTPVFVNRLVATEEYLGENYPLFFSSLKELNNISNHQSIIDSYEYLKKIDKYQFSIQEYLRKIGQSTIYNNL